MDPLFMATNLFRRRRFEECVTVCTEILKKNPLDQAAWFLKARALTEQTYVDETEMEEEGIAELVMGDTGIADVARPGTSLKRPPGTSSRATSQGVRPLSQSGRPLSGFIRPGTQSSRPKTMEQAIMTPRTASTARPVTSSSGRYVRLGTASMLTEADGPFIDMSKMDLSKYAKRPTLAKALFEYLFYHENNVRSALELASLATEACEFEDWWWKAQLGKCYYRLGLYRDAEAQFRSALKQFQSIDTYLLLGKVCIKLDQPLNALDLYTEGLGKFPNDTSLLTGIARIHEGLNDLDKALVFYQDVLKTNSINVEAIACIATHHFYNDQPEIALRFYRRLLQLGVCNAELYANLGLSCFYAQQYDMALNCFNKALALASDENVADIWYNIGHIALGIGDSKLAYYAFKLALSCNSDHAEAYNNLGVLEWRRGHGEQALACFKSSAQLAPHFYEPHYNMATASEKIGNLHDSYHYATKSAEVFPDHLDTVELMKQLKQHFAAL